MSPTSGTPSGGEPIDRTAGEAIRLAHRALDRFPEVVRRHKFVAGGAVISSSLIALAGVAITRRIRAGQTPEEAVANVTAEEVQGLRVIEPEPPAESAEAAEQPDEPESDGAEAKRQLA
ncbi:MAG: hypothetical protein K1X87_02480 [Dehalococcoidia bacterium]|nr:hypothetical protein [Dehalococcoidia bacterium]HRC61860.1 hypothetical protein [Dehalococcoidia bacterium]